MFCYIIYDTWADKVCVSVLLSIYEINVLDYLWVSKQLNFISLFRVYQVQSETKVCLTLPPTCVDIY